MLQNLKREKHSLLELRKHVPKSKREIPSPTPIPPMITLGNDDDDDEEEGRRRRRSHVLGVINTNLRFHFMICCFLGTIYISHTMMMIMIFFNRFSLCLCICEYCCGKIKKQIS